ncbi:copper chaperone PCu(A)C [Cognatishimia sp. F0-27]|uniref:copper chaperone PCu(A)C n=1 Tax=Cognatishimia sp. F0-27 TaxID=2816855 RepID=UPI001D0CB618|nr:copper chaperone PCu(A)C [Cognatishimia sp. F0-27]MCC1492084.1 copper chaperone PCu(A)C [Cognatishimia sp. F0-27]
MTYAPILSSAVALLLSVSPVFAEIVVSDAYARAATPSAKTGAAFMMIENTGDADDRLVAAQTDAAVRVELHTHIADENGVMRMREVEAGFPVPAGGMHMLQRGGDHVMMMGLTRSLNHGDSVTVTLTFENAGDLVVEIPVDLERQPDHGAMKHMNQGGMKQGTDG